MHRPFRILACIGLSQILLMIAFGLCMELQPPSYRTISDSKWRWIHETIHESPPTKLDTVVVGSSLLWCGIDANTFASLRKRGPVWNLGRNWPGMDANYMLVRDLLERHEANHVLLEISYLDESSPHFYRNHVVRLPDLIDEIKFGLAMPTKDLRDTLEFQTAGWGTWLGRAPLRGIYELLRIHRCDPECARFRSTSGSYLADSNAGLNSPTTGTSTNRLSAIAMHYSSSGFDEFGVAPARTIYYLNRLKDLTNKAGAKLWFVVMPRYPRTLPDPRIVRAYRNFGNLIEIDPAIVHGDSFWRDSFHLSKQGAEKFSKAVAARLEELERAPPIHSTR